jgi:hypothetical protein
MGERSLENTVDRLNATKPAYILAGIIFSIILLVAFNYLLPPSWDWNILYRPAAAAFAAGRSPFEIERFSNAPWVLIPMVPLLILPEALGHAILTLCSLVSYSLVCYKFGAKLVGLTCFLLSPPVVQSLQDGNIDWLVTLGFIMPPPVGLFFLAIKPQIGIAVALFWLVQAWRKSGMREVIKVFGPVSIAFVISFLLYGFWPMNYLKAFEWGGNASLWPMSIPIGLALFVTAVRKQNISFAIGASPCLSPYLLLHSWIGPLVAIVSSTHEMIAAVIGLWLLIGIRALGY